MFNRYVLLFLPLAFAVVLPVTAAAQPAAALDTTETNRAPIIPFLESTDVFWTLRGGDAWVPYRLEANIFPHLVVYQNFSDVLDIEQQIRRGVTRVRERAISISGTPAVRVRMLRETSAPVRTPSYMPRGNLQLLLVRGLKDPARGRPAAALTADMSRRILESVTRVSVWEVHVIIGHHSNGQDGCLSIEQERVPAKTGPCLPDGVELTPDSVNRIDGSFSTNYLRSGVNYSRNWLGKGPLEPATKEVRIRAEWEFHPRAWVDEDMVDLYGRHRLNVGTAYALRGVRGCSRRLEGAAGAVWNPQVASIEGSNLEWSFDAQASCFPWGNGGWGFFVRVYTGQDYYNVGFLDEITRLHVGLTFNQSDFFKFRRRPAEAATRR
jgi:hypothetical protein